MLTILFDGVAYGMLLFVLACGLAVTLGIDEFRQPRPWRVRHGRRLRDGPADEPGRRPVPRHAAVRLRHPGAGRDRPRTAALPPPLRREPARSGAADDRPGADGDPRLRLFLHRPAAADPPARLPARPLRTAGRDDRRLSAVPGRRLRPDRRGAAGLHRRHALRRAIARRGRRPPRRRRARHRRRSAVRRRPSRSAAVSPGSAARWPPTWSAASTPASRSSSWCRS